MVRASAVFLVTLLCFLTSPLGTSNDEQFKYLKIPANEFVSSVKSTLDIVQQVMSLVSGFGNAFGDERVSNAISDCIELLDLSTDQLTDTLSVSQNPRNGKDNSTGHPGADMKTWLSAALVNQDTCSEGFDGTNGVVKALVAGSLNQLSSLILQILGNVAINGGGNRISGDPEHVPAWMKGRKLISGEEFPKWMKPDDRRLLLQVNGVNADAVVAADGSGTFSTISEAVKAAPDHGQRFVIYVKKGLYNEYVEISKKKWNIMMIGDGIDITVISGNRNFIDGWTTYRSATFAVKGQGFIARDITFQNTAGPEKHQAVAYRSDSDLSVLYRCAFRGYQDTLYAHSQRQFFRECQITGTVDFIFGDASAVFQNCQILARKGLPNQKNTITAQGRKEAVEPTGFSIQFSNISVEPDVMVNSTYSYLGRPWKLYSRTVVMQSYISSAIRPEGWLEWNEAFALDTLYYAEYLNSGPGAGVGSRVKWPGFHALNSSDQVNSFTVANFLLGNSWLPSTGVKYTAGPGGKLYADKADVLVPDIFWDYTSVKVLTMEWVEGVKLSEQDAIERQGLKVLDLVNAGIQCSLRQLLEYGYFHADPHPGNLLATPDGKLAFLDFGMMSETPEDARSAIIGHVVHLVNRDYEAMARDYYALDFLSPDIDISPIVPALKNFFDDALNATVSELNFKTIVDGLGAVLYEYPFNVPAYYALILRSLTVLEGLALYADPNFKVLAASYPYFAKRLLTDPNPYLRDALIDLLFKDGRFRWNRLENLLVQGKMDKDFSANDALQPVLKLLLGPDGEQLRALVIRESVRVSEAVIFGTMIDTYNSIPGPLKNLFFNNTAGPTLLSDSEQESLMELRAQVIRIWGLLRSTENFDPTMLRPLLQVLQEPEAQNLGRRVFGGITQRFAARLLQQFLRAPTVSTSTL